MHNFGIYIHIPFCKSRCNYCDFSSCTDLSLQEVYFCKLLDEIQACQYSGKVDTIFLGGGTPTAVCTDYIAKTLQKIADKFDIAKNCEITVECNPDSFDGDKLAQYCEMGINRFSLGIQTFDDKILAEIGRRHNAKQAEEALRLLCGKSANFSIDLMLGLPLQDEKDAELSLKLIEKYRIPHVSAYALKIESGTKLHSSGFVADEDLACNLYDILKEGLLQKGIERYEISNFAKPGCECRHNLKYWQRKNYLGFGASAHSLVGDQRFSNSQSIYDYIKDNKISEEILSPADIEWEYIFLNLRTNCGIPLNDFKEKFNADFLQKYSKILDDSFEIGSNFAKIKPERLYVLNSILLKFM